MQNNNHVPLHWKLNTFTEFCEIDKWENYISIHIIDPTGRMETGVALNSI
jgi:hypothetical protein